MNAAQAAHALTVAARLRGSNAAVSPPLSHGAVQADQLKVVCAAPSTGVSLQKDSAQRMFVKRVRQTVEVADAPVERWRPDVHPAVVHHPLDDLIDETVTAGVARAAAGLESDVRVVLDVVPKSWEDDHLRVALDGEETCARGRKCQGFLLADADRCPDWPDDVDGFALVVFKTPQAAERREPSKHHLCLLCLRFDTTTAW